MTPRGVVLPVEGDLDERGCGVLRTNIAAALSTGARFIVLDLTDATEVGREAADLLHGLRRYLQRAEGGLVVVHASAATRSSLVVNGLGDLLSIDDRHSLRLVPEAG